jgi:AcrR family transcriptional regulator
MRKKDNNKKEAIVNAIIQQINEIGFVNVSMSKIAKAAGVSASTLYIYYENKEDMIQEVYADVKTQMLIDCSMKLTSEVPVKQSIMQFCENILLFLKNRGDYFVFLEQASNSPLLKSLSVKDFDTSSRPVYNVFEKGISEGILKQTHPNLLIGFCMYPISQIYKENLNSKQDINQVDFNEVFQMCWDAIKA